MNNLAMLRALFDVADFWNDNKDVIADLNVGVSESELDFVFEVIKDVTGYEFDEIMADRSLLLKSVDFVPILENAAIAVDFADLTDKNKAYFDLLFLLTGKRFFTGKSDNKK